MRNIEWIIFVCHHDGTNLSSGCIERPRIIHSIALRDHTQHRMKFFLNQVPYLTRKEYRRFHEYYAPFFHLIYESKVGKIKIDRDKIIILLVYLLNIITIIF